MSVYSVNGKNPIAAWVASRDDANTGTLFTNDLIGSVDGVLTNMETGDWVADTDAGGIRAWSFDGSNESIIAAGWSGNRFGLGDFAISAWSKATSPASTGRICGSRDGSSGAGYILFQQSGTFYILTDSGAAAALSADSGFSVTTDWHHLVLSRISGTVSLYVDGAVRGTPYSEPLSLVSSAAFEIGAVGNTAFYAGRIDDVRCFRVGLSDQDVSTLWAGGLGRGKLSAVSGGNPRLINGSLIR